MPLTAGELKQVFVDDIGGHAHQIKHGHAQVAPFIGILDQAVKPKRLCQNVADLVPRIEAGIRTLEHHLREPARRVQPPARLAKRQGCATQCQRPLLRCEQPGQHLGQCGFARPAFPDQAGDCAGRHQKAHIAERGKAFRFTPKGCARAAKPHGDVLDFQPHGRRLFALQQPVFGFGPLRRQLFRLMRLGWQPEPRDLAIKRRHGVHQRNGIGVFWRAQNLTCLTRLHHLAVAHDRDAVSDLCDHADVVGDQHKGDLAAVCEVPDQIKHLVLNGDVKCCGRLVRDDQFGIGAKREGDHDTLAHAAEELVRIRLDPLLCVLDPNLFEQIDGAFVGVGIADIGMGLDRLDQLIFDRHQRVQTGLRILKDHRNPVTPDRVLLIRCQAAQVGVTERQFAVSDIAG